MVYLVSIESLLSGFVMICFFITKTRLYNIDPLKPHFYIVKLGFTGVWIIFSYLCLKHILWYSLEPPRRGGSEYPQSMFWAEIWKLSDFLSENFMFLKVKFSIYLNRHVFVMSGAASELWERFHACKNISEDTQEMPQSRSTALSKQRNAIRDWKRKLV